jgi:hypothetical protein
MKRIILAALAAVCLATAVQAQQTLEQAENSDACRIARGERPSLGWNAQSVCDIVKKAAIEREERARQAQALKEQREEQRRNKAISDEHDRIIAQQQLEIQHQLEMEAMQKAKAEAQAKAAEMAKTYERQARERQAAAEAKAIEDAKPINVLFRAYTQYIYVNMCHQNREGYLMVFINDVELDRTEKAIHAIIKQQKKIDPQVDTDFAYSEAMKERHYQISGETCKWSYNLLMNMSPVAEYVIPKPQ